MKSLRDLYVLRVDSIRILIIPAKPPLRGGESARKCPVSSLAAQSGLVFFAEGGQVFASVRATPISMSSENLSARPV